MAKAAHSLHLLAAVWCVLAGPAASSAVREEIHVRVTEGLLVRTLQFLSPLQTLHTVAPA